MNTLAMVMTVSAVCFCWIPGFFGWLGITIGVVGVLIGIMGMTSVKTSPGGLGMDVASWVYGIIVLVTGLSFQIQASDGGLDGLLLPLSMTVATLLAALLLPLFVGAQIVARRRLRLPLAGAAFALYLSLSLCGVTALTLAHRAGILLG